jgi:hypothetical protein
MKVGISTFKALKDGRILIEVNSKEERERISNRITEKCGEELEAKTQEHRNPRLIVYNIPEEVTLENATKIIREQNSDIQLEEGDLQAKYIYRTKRNVRNMVLEVTSHARNQLLSTRIKVGWVICKAADYKTICVNHSSLDKQCPSLQAQLTKYKQNTDY